MCDDDVLNTLAVGFADDHECFFRGRVAGFKHQLMFRRESDHLLHFAK